MALKVSYKPSFVRQMNKLPTSLQDEMMGRIELLKDIKNHQLLKVHKLHGRLRGYYAFSIDFRNRIVFEYISEVEVALLAVGDHTIYCE